MAGKGAMCAALGAGALAAALAAAACEKREISQARPAVVVADPNAERMTIEENTQGEFEKLRIGVGNVWERDAQGASGPPAKALSAQAWISYKDDEQKDTTAVLFPRARITVAEYVIYVAEVRVVGDKGQVTLEIRRQ